MNQNNNGNNGFYGNKGESKGSSFSQPNRESNRPEPRRTSGPNATGSKKKDNKKGKKGRAFLSFLLSVMLIGFFSICAVIAYVLIDIIVFSNGEVAIDLDLEQPQTSFIYAYDSDGNKVQLAKLHAEENREWITICDKMEDKDDEYYNISRAFIALEDKRFFEHKGVDWVRLVGVMTKYSFDQGASTITQQLIKNLTGENQTTFVRKYHEILNALNIEKNYTKEKIMETYLNTLYLGSGCYGIQTAAENYFGKDIENLNLAECAVLAAITKAPYGYNPLYNIDKNRERQLSCLEDMLEQGYITKAEYDEAVNYDLIFTNDPRYVPVEKEDDVESLEEDVWSFYVDYVFDCVADDLVDNGICETRKEAVEKLYSGGLRVYSAVDLDVQEELEDVYENRVTFPKQEDTEENPAIQSAMTIMDYRGRVVAIVGQAGEKKEKRCLNRAADSPRQPGSTIKPLATYAPAIEYDYIHWSKLFKNYAIRYNGKLWPHNVDGSLGSGSNTTVQYAVQVSYNTVPARIISEYLTPETSLRFLKEKFHMSHIDSVQDNNLYAMAIGSMYHGMTTVEMAAAYATFGNGGMYYKPYSYYTVEDSKGDIILDNRNNSGERVLSASTADVMRKILEKVELYSNYGKGSTIRKFNVFHKTGTTDDYKDRWFAGGTPHYVAAVWSGYDKPKTLGNGANQSAKVFIEVFDRIHKNLENVEFEMYGDVVEKKYCRSTGLLAGAGCYSTGTGWYKAESLPAKCTNCSGAPAGTGNEEPTSGAEGETSSGVGGQTSETTTGETTTGAQIIQQPGIFAMN